MQEHRREVLREASVALQGRAVTLWEVSSRAEVTPVMTSAGSAQGADTRLDLDSTLHRWGAPIIQGSRWVGCLLNDAGMWCIAPVRNRPRLPEPDALAELARQPSVIAHEVANPLTAALASLDLSLDLIRTTQSLSPGFRADLLQELAGVGEGMEQAIQFLRSIQDRARGGLACSERFDAANVVRSCVALERPLALKRSVTLQGVITVSGLFLQGDPNALYQVLTNLIRNAVSASRERNSPVVVTLGQVGEALRLTVQDHGVGIAGEHLERIFEPGFTTKEFGSGSGTGLLVVRQITQDMFGGSVKVDSAVGRGTTFEITLPIPVQRTPRGRRQA